MTKAFIIVIILSSLGLKLSAQQVSTPDSLPAFTGYFTMNKVVLEVYKIDSAQVNGIDQTDRYRKASAAIIFYTQSNYPDTLMTVIMPGEDSESWGEIHKLKDKQTPAKKSSVDKSYIQFVWRFTNTVDGLSGNAVVTIQKELKEYNTFTSFIIKGDNKVLCKFDSTHLIRFP
jgi:hypothetical protein